MKFVFVVALSLGLTACATSSTPAAPKPDDAAKVHGFPVGTCADSRVDMTCEPTSPRVDGDQ